MVVVIVVVAAATAVVVIPCYCLDCPFLPLLAYVPPLPGKLTQFPQLKTIGNYLYIPMGPIHTFIQAHVLYSC